MALLSVILLVDPRGRVLLQERDSDAPVAPDKWGMVGGHVERGEDVEVAAYRELEEETAIVLPPGTLTLWRDEEGAWHGREPSRFTVWTAPTRLTDADIVVGEGRQIVFVEPDDVPGLDLAESARHFVLGFVGSPEHAALTAAAAG